MSWISVENKKKPKEGNYYWCCVKKDSLLQIKALKYYGDNHWEKDLYFSVKSWWSEMLPDKPQPYENSSIQFHVLSDDTMDENGFYPSEIFIKDQKIKIWRKGLEKWREKQPLYFIDIYFEREHTENYQIYVSQQVSELSEIFPILQEEFLSLVEAGILSGYQKGDPIPVSIS